MGDGSWPTARGRYERARILIPERFPPASARESGIYKRCPATRSWTVDGSNADYLANALQRR